MCSRIWQWLNDRWPLTALFRIGLEEDVPGGSSYAYTLGSATLILFLVQVVTGMWQLFYYVPTIDHAYDSLDYLRTAVPYGWLIHGLHYWGAQAMVILVALHLARVFIWGAYQRPRELTWLSGVALLLFTLGMSFTGAPLPWDEKGYWAAEVGTNIAGTVPAIGGWLERIVRGGETMGQLTLSRLFVLHVAILPGILVVLIVVHLVAFRRFGSAGPWNETHRLRSAPFWPDQILKDTLVGVLIFLGLMALFVYVRAPFTGPADPVDASYQPKPEWDFLFLYQAIKGFRGRWESVGTVGLPVAGIVLLVLVPFLDRRQERNPAKRLLVMAFGLVAAIGIISLTVAGYYSKPGGAQPATASPPVASVAHLSAVARQGAKLIQSLGCIGCHRINDTGGKVGPDLSHEARQGRSRDWLVTQIRNPKAHHSKTIMPASPTLSDQQVNGLVDYLLSLGAGVASPLALTPGNTGNPPVANGAGELREDVATDRHDPIDGKPCRFCNAACAHLRAAGTGRCHHRKRSTWSHAVQAGLRILPRPSGFRERSQSRLGRWQSAAPEPHRP